MHRPIEECNLRPGSKLVEKLFLFIAFLGGCSAVLTGCAERTPKAAPFSSINNEVRRIHQEESPEPPPETVSDTDAGGKDIVLAGLAFFPGEPPGPLAGSVFYPTTTSATRLVFAAGDVELVKRSGTEKYPYQFADEFKQLNIQGKNGAVVYEILASDSDIVMLKLADPALMEQGWPLMLKGRVKKA